MRLPKEATRRSQCSSYRGSMVPAGMADFHALDRPGKDSIPNRTGAAVGRETADECL